MNIRITRLSMTNFKCFREKEIYLGEDITTIRGRNGAGKTTIADAILFCLFGKNTEGQSDLELFKTRENGKVIPNLDHSVELGLVLSGSAAGKDVTLRRSIKEVWVKKRGSEESVFKNNTVEYFVNGESCTKADYEKYIASLIDERVFRAITNPNYFPSLKWQDQRNFLTAMAGEVEVPADNTEFAELIKQLEGSNEDIVSHLKHLKYQIKQIKDKLEMIPVRLEEQNKALPERLDWDNIKVEYDDVLRNQKATESKIAFIQQGNGSDVKRMELRTAIDNLRKKMNDIEDKAQDAIRKETNEHNQRVSNLTMKFNQELNNQKLMEQTIEADKRMIERCEESINGYTAELERLRNAWPNRKFEITENVNVCPTCGQSLPADVVEGRIETMRTNFNKALEAEKQSLRDKAAKVKQNMADANKELGDAKVKLNDDIEYLQTIKESINTIFSEKAKEEKKLLPTFDDFLPCNEEYQAALRERTYLENEQANITDSDDNKDMLAGLESEKVKYAEHLAQLQQQLATRQQYDRIQSLIEGINKEQKALLTQLSELEKQEDVARQYQFRQNQLLEERINKHFSLVQWRLFRTVNNGGDSFEEPSCECYVNGIPYHAGLNQASRLNAGLDIINALCRFYNVAAPICLDNSESCINIMQTAGQQVRLQVTDTDLQLV